MQQPVVIDPDHVPRALNVVAEKVTVLVSAAQTGSYEIFHQVGLEGSGPPPHSHPWDEAFYVLRGMIAFGAGKKEFVAGPGTFVHLPAKTTHWFRFGEGGGEMLSVTSCEGASRLFADIDREVSQETPGPSKLIEIAARYGAAIALPPG
jgi:quercetin dioxygenase-like cupin family protein